MFTRLMSYSAESNLDLGCRILPVLLADARLPGPASVLQAGFDELDSAAVAFSAAQAATRETEAFRDDAETKFEELVREFGTVALCACGNRPRAQPYILYFPNGYGALRALAARELIQFAGQIVTLLEQETRPRLLSYRSMILESCAEFVAVQERYEVALRAWTDARAYRKAALHRFVRALGRARTLSAFVCDQEPAYVKDIFAPALKLCSSRPKSRKAVETASGLPGLGAPALSTALAIPSTSALCPVAPASLVPMLSPGRMLSVPALSLVPSLPVVRALPSLPFPSVLVRPEDVRGAVASHTGLNSS